MKSVHFNRIVLIYNPISSVVYLSDSYYTVHYKVVSFFCFFIHTLIHIILVLITLSALVTHAIPLVFIIIADRQ